MEKLVIAGREFTSRLFLGTGKFDSNDLMARSIMASGTEMVTVAMKRIELEDKEDDMLKHIVRPEIQLLPNTSGVRNAEEAVFAAQMAREAFGTNWLKLEIHPDPRYLLPDSTETLKATEQLVKLGFVVLPYCQADPTLCKHLEEAGAATVMPLGAPIGTNKGLQTRDFLRIIIEQANVPVVVDAGIGAPSHAAEAMEMGASACLVNTAIAVAGDPVAMAPRGAQVPLRRVRPGGDGRGFQAGSGSRTYGIRSRIGIADRQFRGRGQFAPDGIFERLNGKKICFRTNWKRFHGRKPRRGSMPRRKPTCAVPSRKNIVTWTISWLWCLRQPLPIWRRWRG